MILFISGLPGSGKSTIGKEVAERLNWKFIETDSFLSEEMKERVEKGELLTSEQLDKWIGGFVIPNLVQIEQVQPIVAAGILAEEKFRNKLVDKVSNILFINLDVSYDNLQDRVTNRDHFAKNKMLDKCWEAKDKFQLPGPVVDGNKPIDCVVRKVLDIVDNNYKQIKKRCIK